MSEQERRTGVAAVSAEAEIRLVSGDDWATWRTLRLRSLADSPDAFGSTLERELEFTEADWRVRADGEGPAVLALLEGEPMAMGAGWPYAPGKLMVVAMWTDPLLRGRGIGTRILDAVVTWARDHDRTPDLWVADANPAARAVYERYGFVPDGQVAPLREGSPLTMSHLVLADATTQVDGGCQAGSPR